VLLQFDARRGTTQQLSKARVPVGRLHAVFFTHIHSDHSEGLIDMAQLRWHFNSGGPKLDVVCSEDAISGAGHTISCENFASSIGDTLIASGEMAQRLAESPKRLPGGPADLLNTMTFTPSNTAQVVWEKDDVTVSAIRSTHVPGHASYRVDTPAGSVVIGGDAGKDADILVHSVIHPVMGPDGSSGFPPPIYFRQSTATDLGSLSDRAGVGHLMLTHLIPPMGAPQQGPYPIEGGGLSEADYADAVRDGGFGGDITVGTDMATHRIVKE
jgi:ribonuclease Z